MVSLMAWWIAGKESEGSGSGSESQPKEVEEEGLYVEGGGKVGVSEGRIMPSSRR
jgi:hypothetical protein